MENIEQLDGWWWVCQRVWRMTTWGEWVLRRGQEIQESLEAWQRQNIKDIEVQSTLKNCLTFSKK